MELTVDGDSHPRIVLLYFIATAVNVECFLLDAKVASVILFDMVTVITLK